MDKSRKKIIILTTLAIAVAAVIAIAVWLVLRQPGEADFRHAKDTQLQTLADAGDKVSPAINTYLQSYKKAYNKSGSINEAKSASKKDYQSFIEAQSAVKDAVQALRDNRISNDNESGAAVSQLETAYNKKMQFTTGIVESYPLFVSLFSDKGEKLCSDMFLGETSGFADRKKRLGEALENCYPAINQLKKSKNSSYVDYAKKLEKRLKQLQQYSAATAKGEQDYKNFSKQAKDYNKQYADAKKRNASDEELYKLADEIKKTTEAISDSQSAFESAAKKYSATIKELVPLYADVFSEDIPDRLKTLNKLTDIRVKTLKLILEDKLT